MKLSHLSPADIQLIIKKIMHDERFDSMRFSRVESNADWDALKIFRLRTYDQALKYMLNELTSDGLDVYDEHSLVFAAWYEDRIVASVRLTPVPFETTRYISSTILTNFLEDSSPEYYLEWSRLLVDTSVKMNNLLSAITVYAGLHILMTTPYLYYFGYTKPIIRRILGQFQLAKEKMSFTIPSRGPHTYWLLKGSFMNDFNHLINLGYA